MKKSLLTIIAEYIAVNRKIFYILLIAFALGVIGGIFSVNGLSNSQEYELGSFIEGFIKLAGSENIDSTELVRLSLRNNIRIAAVIWVLGVSIIGIPLIFVIVMLRGFVTGFSAGFILHIMGIRGAFLVFSAILLKEIIILPFVIALGVNGINFSHGILKAWSKHNIYMNSLKSSLFKYCSTTVLCCFLLFAGIMVEGYIVPVFVKIIVPIL